MARGGCRSSRPLFRRRYGLERQLDREAGSSPDLALDVEPAVHRLDETFGDDEAEPAPLDRPAPRTQALEGAEELLEVVGSDACAGVGHCHPHRSAFRLGDRDPHGATFPVVLDRVGDEVEQHLLQAQRVDKRASARGFRVCLLETDAALCRERLCEREDLVDGLADLDRLDREGDPPGLDPGDVEQFVDESQQVLATAQDVPRPLAFLFVRGVTPEDLRESEDRRQRRSQLVAHVREEEALRLVRALGFLLRPPDFLVSVHRGGEGVDLVREGGHLGRAGDRHRRVHATGGGGPHAVAQLLHRDDDAPVDEERREQDQGEGREDDGELPVPEPSAGGERVGLVLADEQLPVRPCDRCGRVDTSVAVQVGAVGLPRLPDE